jgi:PAS domain-containing protein
MNSISIDFKFFIESDNTPFILFDNIGKIVYLNNSAEILLGYVSKQELYNITLSYAPKNFGSRSTMIQLQYNLFSFYAIK